MRYIPFTLSIMLMGTTFMYSCQSKEKSKPTDDPLVQAAYTKEAAVQRGRYIVSTSGCNDCHSPKKMTAQGPAVDSGRLLSGHPAGSPLPPINGDALKPGNWVLMAPDITAFVGPWGVSFAANLTSDSATGIGTWTEEQFIKTLRTGKHLGMENGRPILPPMPWDVVGQMTDDDLRAVLAYLKSLPSVTNRVPGPIPPDQVQVNK